MMHTILWVNYELCREKSLKITKR